MGLAEYVIVWILLGFLAGSIPFGWLVSRAKGLDIRLVGSGNIGMTNVWRALGWQWGITVFILDMCKGLLPVLALRACQPYVLSKILPEAWSAPLLMLVAGATVLGHAFTPWLRFRGGKGIATGFGSSFGLYSYWILLPLLLFFVVAAVSRYISLGSLAAALAVLVLSLAFPAFKPLWPFGLAVALLIFWTHRDNIRRLLARTENRFSWRSSGQGKQDQPDVDDAG